MYLFSNILGVFVFDGQFGIVDELLFKNIEDYKNKEKLIEGMKIRHKSPKEPDDGELKKMLIHFKNNGFFSDFYHKNLQLTKLDVKNSVNDGTLLIQAVKSIEEIDKAASILVKRLREWYELHNPEFSVATQNHEKFVEDVLGNDFLADIFWRHRTARPVSQRYRHGLFRRVLADDVLVRFRDDPAGRHVPRE